MIEQTFLVYPKRRKVKRRGGSCPCKEVTQAINASLPWRKEAREQHQLIERTPHQEQIDSRISAAGVLDPMRCRSNIHRGSVEIKQRSYITDARAARLYTWNKWIENMAEIPYLIEYEKEVPKTDQQMLDERLRALVQLILVERQKHSLKSLSFSISRALR